MAEVDHHRLSRRDLREPDEFQVLTGRAAGWARGHRQLLIGVGATVAALASVLAGVSWNAARSVTAATTRLGVAQAMVADGKFVEATSELDGLAKGYPRTAAGRLATLYRAHALMSQGKYPEAAAAYDEYLATGPATDYLRQAALFGLASAQDGAANATAAEEAYRQAIQLNGPYLTDARIGLAGLQIKAGQSDAAASILNEILATPDLDPEARAVAVARLGARSGAGQQAGSDGTAGDVR